MKPEGPCANRKETKKSPQKENYAGQQHCLEACQTKSSENSWRLRNARDLRREGSRGDQGLEAQTWQTGIFRAASFFANRLPVQSERMEGWLDGWMDE